MVAVTPRRRDNGVPLRQRVLRRHPRARSWHKVTDGGRNVANQLISEQLLIEYFDIESPLLIQLRASVAAEVIASGREDRPFVPDPPGALDALIVEYRAKQAP